MNKLVFIFSFLLFSVFSFCQTNAKSLLQSEIIKLLEGEHLLLTPPEKSMDKYDQGGIKWSNPRQRRKAIEKDDKLRAYLLGYFSIPSFCADKNINTNYVFRDKSIGKLGSYIITNNNLSVIDITEPDLPVLLTGNQLSIPDPKSDGSSYVLNFTSSKLFKAALSGGAEGGISGIFDAKLKSSLAITNDRKTQVSLASGVFQNQLDLLFKKVINNQLQPSDFSPIYYVWLAHKNNLVPVGAQVISSFEGMAFYSSNGVQSDEDLTFDAALNAQGKFPFLSLSTKGTTDWSSSTGAFKQTNIYNIYMFKAPTLSVIPSPDQILGNWKNMTNSGSAIVSANRSVPADAPLVLNVKFGPVPNKDVLQAVKLDENYSLAGQTGTKFINSVRLIPDAARIKQDESGFYYIFDVEVNRNEDFIATAQNAIGKMNCLLPLRIYIDNPIGNKYLEKVYDPVALNTDTYPTPYFTEIDGYVLKPSKDAANNFIYKTKIAFKMVNGKTVETNKQPIKIIDVYGLPANVDANLKNLILAAPIRTIGDNNFEINISMGAGSKYFDANRRSYDVEALLTFYDNNGKGYQRRLPLTLLAPDEQLNALVASNSIENVIVKDNDELVKVLNAEAELKDGRKIKDVQAANTKDGKLDVLAFVEEIKKQTNLTITPESKYQINAIYVDKSKLTK